MNDRIARPLAEALSAKGYETLTAVQEAVLTPEAEGRDLLVSAQTGSGKTVAFGLSIAPDVLNGSDLLLFADRPVALVIAPTRELAQQVAREFGWLYEPAEARIATCVGGMDYRTERRALSAGAHIVVGTPGRLRDHIERGSLDLSGVRAVVLDEADEMLDLGFAEDLEFILSAAPAERRTLMFSATVPADIEKLARTFQKDALRLQTAGEARQHADIEYRALNVASRDRDHAIFNVLRYYEAQRAIIFCKTRVAVNHLLARLGNRGFNVVALSGELSQQERMHALQALRDGRARVCIATDVAARGIDLPGLELVIHADLPANSETLLHRSGRTGRAGSKGVSVLIVPPAEFRKAHRLLQGAKVVAEWAKAPSAEEVAERDAVRLMEDAALTEAPAEEDAALAAELVARHGADRVAAAFLKLWRVGRAAPEELSDTTTPAAPAAPRPKTDFGPAVWFTLSVGHTGRAEARWLLPKICDAGGITRTSIGAIRVQQDETFVQISAPVAAQFAASTELEPGLTLRRMEGEPDLAAPARGRPREDRGERKPYAPRPPRGEGDDARPPRRDEGSRSLPTPRVLRDDSGNEERPRKPYAAREDGERKPYPKREDGDRGYGKREDGERKPYAKREEGDRKPYARREDGDRKPYAKRDDGDRPAYGKREGGERKPYPKREDGDRKPRSDAPHKPYAKREDGDRKPYAKRDDAASKPWAKPERAAPKPYARKDAPPAAEGDEPRKPRWKTKADAGPDARPQRSAPAEGKGKPPFKSAGFKSHGGKPGPSKSAGMKSHGKSDAPRRPAQDASDTSKRFVPPKKPKG